MEPIQLKCTISFFIFCRSAKVEMTVKTKYNYIMSRDQFNIIVNCIVLEFILFAKYPTVYTALERYEKPRCPRILTEMPDISTGNWCIIVLNVRLFKKTVYIGITVQTYLMYINSNCPYCVR